MKSIIVSALVVVLFLGITPNYGYGQVQKQIIKIEKKGKQGYLGVQVQDVNKKLKDKKDLVVDRGAYIQDVVEDSPAEEAGIQKGDVIVKFGNEDVDDGEELTEAVRATKPRSEVKIELYRKSDKKTITVTVGKLKTPEAFAYSFGDNTLGMTPKLPNVSKSLNLRLFTESEINGMHFQSLTKQLGEYFGAPNGKGVLVSEVKKGSDAEKSGFKAGDVIIKIDDHSVANIDALHEKLSDFDGKEIPVEIIRNGKSMKLTLKVEEKEEEDDDWGMMIAPQSHHYKSFQLNIDKLRDQLANLKERMRHLRHPVEGELVGS